MKISISSKQPIYPFWVRFRYFRCTYEELKEYYNRLKQNKSFIIFKIDKFQYTKDGVNIPVYYLEQADLTDENPYKQSKDWQKHPWDAPADAVEWKSVS